MAFSIPSMLLKQLYTFGSLENVNGSVKFSVKNRLSDATITSIDRLKLSGNDVPLDKVTLDLADGEVLTPAQLSANPIDFPLRRELDIYSAIDPLPLGGGELPGAKHRRSAGGAVEIHPQGHILIEGAPLFLHSLRPSPPKSPARCSCASASIR